MTPQNAEMLALLTRAREEVVRARSAQTEGIAVVGIAARFPGADDLDAFWRLLEDGRSGLQRVSEAELTAADVPVALRSGADYVPVWGGPSDTDGFDAAFFGYAPREAELLDPQQRMFLECAWHALEDAGYDSLRLSGPVGVYAGASLSSHLLRAVGRADGFQAGLANIGGMVAARASFHLDLKGPSIGVQTTCSSALVAVHQAMAGLRAGECDMALAGAVAVNQSRPEGYVHEPGGIAAPDGICRPFDAAAAGTVFTNGAAVVVLKRLSDAISAGDTIHGVLLGSAVNNDGAGKVGITAPSVSGQAAVLAAALRAARVTADQIDYVEAHGTGTAMGDPIELAALRQGYGPALEQAGRRCGLGAVKGNVGHLDAAAGMAGLVKILLAFRHGRLPGTAHFSAPNPHCDFGPFEVSAQARRWPHDPDRPRRAGLSAFGIGGTNAHILVQEPPVRAPADASHALQLLPLSSRTPEGLARLSHDLAGVVAGTQALPDIAFTLQNGRRSAQNRRFVTARDGASAQAALRAPNDPIQPLAGTPEPVFLFSGQGSQNPGMARDLHAADPLFRAALEDCLAVMPCEIRTFLLEGGEAIHQTAHAQPALFALEWALAQMWLARGIAPVALVGHSIGEFVAAALAGVFTLPDAIRVVLARGRAMQDCAPGAMLAVMMSEAEALGNLPEGVGIAAVNGPRAVVLAGPEVAIDALARRLDRSGVGARMLVTSHAFHSAMMEPALAPFAEAMVGVTLNAPQIPIISTVTGDWMRPEEATDPAYWVRQLRQPVRFGDAMAVLTALDHPLLLEVGPGTGLIRLARQGVGKARGIASLPDSGALDGVAEALCATGDLWAAGVDIDWGALHGGNGNRVSLPGTPFERQSFWLPPASAVAEEPSERFHEPVWQRLPLAQPGPALRRLVLGADGLARHGWQGGIAVNGAPGDCFTAEGQGFRLDPTNPDHMRQLLAALQEPVDEIICGWGLADPALIYSGTAALLQALANGEARPRLTLVGTGMQEVTGAEALDPMAAMAQGLLPVLAQELPGMAWRLIDLDPAETARPVAGLAEALADWQPGVTALRRGYLWRQDHAPVRLAAAQAPDAGPYLITGDLVDGLAAGLLRALRATGAAVVLAGHGLPPPQDWEGWMARRGAEDPAARMIGTLRAAGRIGHDILVFAGDETNADWLESVLTQAEAQLGPVSGVFHTSAMGDAFHAPLSEPPPAKIAQRLGLKHGGVVALRQVLRRRPARFCLVQSSLSVLVGGYGFGPYAAANAALEAEVALARRDGPTQWQVVQWDAAETGSLSGTPDLPMLSEQDVWQAACAVLSQPRLASVTVSPIPLKQRRAVASRPATPAATPRRTAFIAPRDAYEAAVAQAMAEMLGVSNVGAEDNFFELGGHSLLAIQIVNRLRKEFEVDLPVRALLFEAPTVAGIATAIRKAREAAEQEADLLTDLLDGFQAEPEDTNPSAKQTGKAGYAPA